LQGQATVASYPGILPRNEIKMEIVAPNNIDSTQATLDAYALSIAQDTMSFYGTRHYYYDLTSILTDDMYDWDLLDLITINGEQYFILSLDIDEPNTSIHFELVSVEGYSYDPQQARVPLSPANYNNTSGGNFSTSSVSSSGGSVSALNYTSALPLKITGAIISLDYSDNLKLSNDNKLDTVQDIKTTSTPQFARLGIGGAADATIPLKIYGDISITGSLTLGSDFNLATGKVYKINSVEVLNATGLGAAVVNSSLTSVGTLNQDLNIASGKVYKINGTQVLSATALGSAVVSSSLTSIGTLGHDLNVGNSFVYKINGTQVLSATALGSAVVSSSLTSIGTLGHDLNVGNSFVYKINGTQVLSATTLGSNVINSSLTSVGIISSGTWQGTTIKAGYIAFNSTNLKNDGSTTFALNTIQDICPTATNFTTAGQTLNGTLLQVGSYSIYNNFTSGWAGAGYRLDYGLSIANKSSLEIDNLTVRGTLSVYELLVRQIRATNGAIFVTASAKVKTVNGTTITFDDETNSNLCPFSNGDLIIAQRYKPDGISIVRQVEATVSSVSGASVVVSYTTGTFIAGDEVVRIGNTSTSTRQNSIYLTSDDSNSPFIDMITGVDSWSAWGLASKTKLRIGNLTGITDSDFGGALSGYGLYAQNIYLKGNIKMTSGSITWSNINKPTQSDLGTWTTYINSSGIYTGTITLNQLNFTPVQNTNVVASINASSEGIVINGAKIQINGSTTFASGYDPSTKSTITNSDVTTIIGNTVTTSYLNAKNITALGAVTAGTFSLNNGTFAVDANGKLTSTSAAIAGWDITSSSISKTNTSGYKSLVVSLNSSVSNYTTGLVMTSIDNSATKLVLNAGSYNDGGYARYGFAIWDNINSKFLMNIGYGGSGSDMVAKISGLTIEGDMVSSQFSTGAGIGSNLNTDGFSLTSGSLYGRITNASVLNTVTLYANELLFYAGSSSAKLDIICTQTNRQILIDNAYNVPKCFGVTDSPPTTNRQVGDTYIGTNYSTYMWNGSTWIQTS
jgi:hypothetical protein